MDRLIELLPKFWVATGETLYIVGLAMLFGGIAGLILGLGLYVTRRGSILDNKWVFGTLNVVVNTFRPIPFIIFLVAVQPLVRQLIGTGIGNAAIIVTLSIAASFGISRIVEQNLLTVQPGVIEAARSVGAGPWRIVGTILLPEAFGPLILGYTFVFVAIVDMATVAGLVGGGGLGAFSLSYGYKQFNPAVTWTAVVLLIVLVQVVQAIGNAWAKRVLRR